MYATFYEANINLLQLLKFSHAKRYIGNDVAVASEILQLSDPPMEIVYFTAMITESIYFSLVGAREFRGTKGSQDAIQVHTSYSLCTIYLYIL